jgi:hypothetical protein
MQINDATRYADEVIPPQRDKDAMKNLRWYLKYLTQPACKCRNNV